MVRVFLPSLPIVFCCFFFFFAVFGTTSCAQPQHPEQGTILPSFLANAGTAAGFIDDTKCSIEDLEQANDSQLYAILQELRATKFFRNFIVDLEKKCPLEKWRTGSSSGDAQDDEEEEFQCAGGTEDEEAEFAEPACHVDTGSEGASFQSENPFDSNALNFLSKSGFESKEQKDTFSWKQHSDKVTQSSDPVDCAEEEQAEDLFWMDMCHYIHAGEGKTIVNLASNPERNTMYNGTHIWRAIYEENCMAVSQDDNDIDKLKGASDYTDTCFEERVLYRLLSGLHTSTTLSIAKHYYAPSKRKGRENWEPNPEYFMEKLGSHPDYIRNLHFSYVVLLRALKKASPILHDYDIRTGDIVQDETASVLLKRLLDSSILQSCSGVFHAFDENLMFHESNPDAISLQQNFKGVFHNISSILDCVQCQQCKLHGKMAMLGYGAALKVLFMKSPTAESLERNEIVAFINTVAKFSESIREIRELTNLYMQNLPLPQGTTSSDSIVSIEYVDRAVGLAASLGQQGKISFSEEQQLVTRALERDPDLLILAKHYASDEDKFLALSGLSSPSSMTPDAIVVGTGLAGLTVTLNMLDRGGRVILIEKEHSLGGNSNKASSGINACCFEDGPDSLEVFKNDTIRSAGESAQLDLIETLVSRSASAVEWLRSRAGVDLSLKAQLGGHSSKRTHRPKNGMVGAEIIFAMQKHVRKYEKTGQLTLMVDTKVTELLTDETGKVIGVHCESATDPESSPTDLYADNVVLAVGGFAADRSSGSLLSEYRPELLKMPTTAGHFSTGDGVRLASSLGAGMVDMDKVQVHPTGWVDPADPENTSKTLAAELMRGVGGILINKSGERFCNELGTRAYVTDRMLSHNPLYNSTGKWSVDSPLESFYLVLSSSAAEDGKKHVDLYTHKGLMTRLDGVSALSQWMGLPQETVVATLKKYQNDASRGLDSFGKTSFRGVPQNDLENEVFYAGMVTPVLHYCMGGITIDTEGNVLDSEGKAISGLHAAGEVTGGVHGGNRLGGNSLLECTVYGTIVGQKLPIKQRKNFLVQQGDPSDGANKKETRNVSLAELKKHDTPDDCWVAIHGTVYDLTEFADEHPAGAQSIHNLAGKDGTQAFAAVHGKDMLKDFEEDLIGPLIVL